MKGSPAGHTLKMKLVTQIYHVHTIDTQHENLVKRTHVLTMQVIL